MDMKSLPKLGSESRKKIGSWFWDSPETKRKKSYKRVDKAFHKYQKATCKSKIRAEVAYKNAVNNPNSKWYGD